MPTKRHGTTGSLLLPAHRRRPNHHRHSWSAPPGAGNNPPLRSTRVERHCLAHLDITSSTSRSLEIHNTKLIRESVCQRAPAGDALHPDILVWDHQVRRAFFALAARRFSRSARRPSPTGRSGDRIAALPRTPGNADPKPCRCQTARRLPGLHRTVFCQPHIVVQPM